MQNLFHSLLKIPVCSRVLSFVYSRFCTNFLSTEGICVTTNIFNKESSVTVSEIVLRLRCATSSVSSGACRDLRVACRSVATSYVVVVEEFGSKQKVSKDRPSPTVQ